MKIIALKGEENSGKTTTLKKVYDLLMKMGGEQEPDCIKKLEGNPEDIRDVINFAGKKIGIVTQGDYDRGNYNKNIPSDKIQEDINKKVKLAFDGDIGKDYLFSDLLKDITKIILDFLEQQKGLTIEEHLKILESKGCDIAICAYRPDIPKTEEFLEEYPNPISLFLQNKSEAKISNDQLKEKANQKAKEIIEYLKKLILHA
ncbi:hypothetical protein [Prevotella aurantiaca]|uniref:hypothetical protein n=1 Tax=Prevotella aurantiaca TaxID=596085 RepID=UPI0028DC1DE6|nr:hypothetical protein [Prevotella aurantiaca]